MKKAILILLVATSGLALAAEYDASGLPVTLTTITQAEASTNAVYTPTQFKLEYVIRDNTPILRITGRVTVVDGEVIQKKSFKCDSIEEAAFVLGPAELEAMLAQFGTLMKKFLE